MYLLPLHSTKGLIAPAKCPALSLCSHCPSHSSVSSSISIHTLTRQSLTELPLLMF